MHLLLSFFFLLSTTFSFSFSFLFYSFWLFAQCLSAFFSVRPENEWKKGRVRAGEKSRKTVALLYTNDFWSDDLIPMYLHVSFLSFQMPILSPNFFFIFRFWHFIFCPCKLYGRLKTTQMLVGKNYQTKNHYHFMGTWAICHLWTGEFYAE